MKGLKDTDNYAVNSNSNCKVGKVTSSGKLIRKEQIVKNRLDSDDFKLSLENFISGKRVLAH